MVSTRGNPSSSPLLLCQDVVVRNGESIVVKDWSRREESITPFTDSFSLPDEEEESSDEEEVSELVVSKSSKSKSSKLAASKSTVDLTKLARTMASNNALYCNNKETTAKLLEASKNSNTYEKGKDATVRRFFRILSCSPHFRLFSEDIPHPTKPNKTTKRIFELCGGMKTDEKHQILNYCLVYYQQNLVLKSFADVDLDNAWSKHAFLVQTRLSPFL